MGAGGTEAAVTSRALPGTRAPPAPRSERCAPHRTHGHRWRAPRTAPTILVGSSLCPRGRYSSRSPRPRRRSRCRRSTGDSRADLSSRLARGTLPREGRAAAAVATAATAAMAGREAPRDAAAATAATAATVGAREASTRTTNSLARIAQKSRSRSRRTTAARPASSSEWAWRHDRGQRRRSRGVIDGTRRLSSPRSPCNARAPGRAARTVCPSRASAWPGCRWAAPPASGPDA